MKFHPTPIPGAFTIEIDKHSDQRGFFARMFCQEEFSRAGLRTRFVQINDSVSISKGTLRGMHYQLPPSAEVKLVRCVRGKLWDAILDLRPNSPTFQQWYGVDLSMDDCRMIYIPRGCAHSILTLTDQTEVIYLVSESYAPSLERGVRWNDPRFKIRWPIEPAHISQKDQMWPDLDAEFHGTELLLGLDL